MDIKPIDIKIYKDFTDEEKELLRGQTCDYIKLQSSPYVPIRNSISVDWAAIFVPWLMDNGTQIYLTGTKVYMKQADLDYYYPTNPEGRPDRVYGMFCNEYPDNSYQIRFIHTGTGIKVFEYASALTENRVLSYVNHPEVAVALTQHQRHKVKVFHSGRTVYVLSNEFNDLFVHSMLALFPFIFGISNLKEDENIANICKAITKNESIRQYYTDILSNLKDLRDNAKYNILINMLNKGNTEAIKDVKARIASTEDTIQDYEDRVEANYKKLQELNTLLLGYLETPKATMETVQEILDYISKHRYIKSMTARKDDYYGRDYLRFIIDAPITIYETEPLRRTMKATVSDASERTKLIYKAFNRIFLKEEYQMICESIVDIDPINHNFQARNDSSVETTKMYHPHLTSFNCWGDNRNIINKDLSQNNLIGALNGILIATQNINFTDSAVFNRWINSLRESPQYLSRPTVLDKQTGELKTLQEIIEIAKDDDLDFKEE